MRVARMERALLRVAVQAPTQLWWLEVARVVRRLQEEGRKLAPLGGGRREVARLTAGWG